MRRFGFLGLLVPLLFLGAVGVLGYNWGYSNGLAQVAADGGATVVHVARYGVGFGFPFFGLILGLLFFGLIFSFIRRAIWGWGGGWGGHHGRFGGYGPRGYGPGGHGPGGYGPGHQHGPAKGMPPFADQMLKDWHRTAHGDAPAPAASKTDGTNTTSSTGGTSPA